MIAETLEALNDRKQSGASENSIVWRNRRRTTKTSSLHGCVCSSKWRRGRRFVATGFEKQQNASRTTEELTVALKQQIDQGLVEVEQRDDKVFITVGSGGAFPSGTADLTDEAQRILDRISLAAMSPESKITVTGHTDDVPISNAQFRDNWDLAASRASSVVQAIQRTGLIDGDRLSPSVRARSLP